MPNCYVGVPQGQYIKTYNAIASDSSLLTNPQAITYLSTSERITLTRSSITSTIHLTESVSSSITTSYTNSAWLASEVIDSIWKYCKATKNSTTYSNGKISTITTYNTTISTNYFLTSSESMTMKNASVVNISFFTSEDNKGYLLFDNNSFSSVSGTERSYQTATHTTTNSRYESWSEPYTFQSYSKSYGGASTNTRIINSIVIYNTDPLFNDINNSSWGSTEQKSVSSTSSDSTTISNNTLYGETILTRNSFYTYSLTLYRTDARYVSATNDLLRIYLYLTSHIYLKNQNTSFRLSRSAITFYGYLSAVPVNITGVSYEYSPEASSITKNANYLWTTATSNYYRGISTSAISINNNVAKNIKKIYIGGN